jgi:hypothetical protein
LRSWNVFPVPSGEVEIVAVLAAFDAVGAFRFGGPVRAVFSGLLDRMAGT